MVFMQEGSRYVRCSSYPGSYSRRYRFANSTHDTRPPSSRGVLPSRGLAAILSGPPAHSESTRGIGRGGEYRHFGVQGSTEYIMVCTTAPCAERCDITSPGPTESSLCLTSVNIIKVLNRVGTVSGGVQTLGKVNTETPSVPSTTRRHLV